MDSKLTTSRKYLDYMNEVKPFSAKVREYKDGKSGSNVDVIGQNNISDYDRPPFVDLVSGTVRILDEGVARDVDTWIMSNSKQYIDYVTSNSRRRTNQLLIQLGVQILQLVLIELTTC